MHRPSMRKAIDSMCKGCVYDEANAGAWREQVEGCTVWDCPLWVLRPVSMGKSGMISKVPEKFDVEHMKRVYRGEA